MIDDIVCDMLAHATQVDRPHVQGQAEQGLGRPQLVFSVDPYTGLPMAFRLSYEETKSEH